MAVCEYSLSFLRDKLNPEIFNIWSSDVLAFLFEFNVRNSINISISKVIYHN